MEIRTRDTDREKISALAGQILALAHDDILIHLRFLNTAMARLVWQEKAHIGCMATDGVNCYYDPVQILKSYREEPRQVARCYLHLLLHCIFSHSFHYDRLEPEDWDLAADIAVENVILEMKLPGVTLDGDVDAARRLASLREDTGSLTAERIYRYLRRNPVSPSEREELTRLFERDAHTLWMPGERAEGAQEEWKKISERMKAELKSFAGKKSGSESLEQNLEETTRERYDYGAILRRFTVMGEEIAVNDDEFDLVYYTYGLERYGNLPLIEPLEYKESRKVREFVIAIDTSASCRGSVVKAFLRKTYSLLKSSENFFRRVNVHIIQCDSQVRSDTKVTNDDEFERFMKYGRLSGFGATDFRPVFDYVETLREQGEFENLKGLIYFTDGYGIYPERRPDYDVIFAFLDQDANRAPVPVWSMKAVLESEELEDGEHL